ncbi:MAG: hypothetical protein IKW90_15970 [Lachnospiraceae bacterium]|nr:hypothetical protein [Lachnospiraceae bacterium]
MITKEEFKKMELDMTYEEYKACYCKECSNKGNCKCYHDYRRFPRSAGGNALCPNLNK